MNLSTEISDLKKWFLLKIFLFIHELNSKYKKLITDINIIDSTLLLYYYYYQNIILYVFYFLRFLRVYIYKKKFETSICVL